MRDDLAALIGAPVGDHAAQGDRRHGGHRCRRGSTSSGLIETAVGVEQASGVAAAAHTHRLMLGSADLAAELGIALSADEGELQYPRARVAMSSAAAGIEPPIDVVYLDVRDSAGLRDSALRAKQLGFTGKACIPPRTGGSRQRCVHTDRR